MLINRNVRTQIYTHTHIHTYKYTRLNFNVECTVTAHIACITSRVGREKNNLGTPIGHVYLTSIYNKQKYTLKSVYVAVSFLYINFF